MEANKILHSDLLDIVFDNRNKEYGAYQLRKGYNTRLLISLAGVVVFTGMLFGANYLVQHSGVSKKQALAVVDVQLEEIKEEKKAEALPPPPPPPKAPIQKVEIIKFTPPRIVKDNEVKQEDKPPEQECRRLRSDFHQGGDRVRISRGRPCVAALSE